MNKRKERTEGSRYTLRFAVFETDGERDDQSRRDFCMGHPYFCIIFGSAACRKPNGKIAVHT